jgi:translocation and assembly module TamA
VLGVQRQIKHESGWQRTWSLRWLRDTTEPPDTAEQKTDLLLPGFSLDRTRTRGGTDPYWGDRLYYQMEVGSRDVLSDANLVSLRGGFRVLRTLGDRHLYILRGDAGTILTDDFDNVPQAIRFFAGGDQSIRGYDYKSISPRDKNGVPVGARNLLTGSIEYNYTFIPRWRAALFVDGGSAFDTFTDPFYVGTGVGVRWVSPVGPIRLDVASAISESGHPLRLHFSMGPNL